MDFPVFLNKFILSRKFLRYTPFWHWYLLVNHRNFRFDDYGCWKEFWYSINSGWEEMEYVHRFEEFWGKGSYPPPTMIVSKEDYDFIEKSLNEEK